MVQLVLVTYYLTANFSTPLIKHHQLTA